MISPDTFYNLLYAWIALAIMVFGLLLFVKVPYGRHTSKNWGPGIRNRWAWFLMELPAIVSFSYFLFSGINEMYWLTWGIFGLFVLHYIRRTFIFPFQMHENGKSMPVVIVIAGMLFNTVNGFFNGYYFGNIATKIDVSWLTDLRFILGISLFVIGMYINISSDQIVLNLRKGGKKGYFIPTKGLYRYISSPNLFGEIIEWSGWALLSWSLPTFSFAIWSMANLVPRSLDHHRWYKEKFADYPKQRKAIIPGVI